MYFNLFSNIFNIIQNKLTAILSWYKEHGITSRKKSHEANTLRLEMADIQRILTFLTNHAEECAVVFQYEYQASCGWT